MISFQGTTNLIYYASQMNDPAVDLVRVNVKHPASSCSIRCQGSGSGKGAGKCAPRPFWAYRGAKQSEKAGMAGDWSNASHPVGKRDAWGDNMSLVAMRSRASSSRYLVLIGLELFSCFQPPYE